MWRLRVREEVQTRGYTLARLHRETELDLKTIRRLWHEPGYNAELRTLARVASVFRIPPTALIEDQEDE